MIPEQVRIALAASFERWPDVSFILRTEASRCAALVRNPAGNKCAKGRRIKAEPLDR